jgi:hypothetical protein
MVTRATFVAMATSLAPHEAAQLRGFADPRAGTPRVPTTSPALTVTLEPIVP